MGLDRILTNQNIAKRNSPLPKIALALSMTLAVPTFFAAKCSIEIRTPEKRYEIILKNDESVTKEKISLTIDGKIENFTYSPEVIKEKELKQGIIVWEKLAKGNYNSEEISYPTGHLYVFKDINSRNIVGKFAVSGGVIGNDIESIRDEVYVLNKFEKYPPFLNELGEVIYEGGDKNNPWGDGRFYHYPIAETGSTMEILSKQIFKRYTAPDKQKRYLHACSLMAEGFDSKEDYETKQVEAYETNFKPSYTIGCTKTSNHAIDFLEERINPGVFRLAYVDNTKN